MKGKITFIQILLIIVLLLSGFEYFKDRMDKSESHNDFQKLQEEVSERSDKTDIILKSEKDDMGMLIKYKDLYNRNNDLAGWVKIDGTNIDYPVMHTPQSNAYYLHRDINREYSSAGTPVLDFQCDTVNMSDNMIVYAHNMKNGTMFHDLLNYSDEKYYSDHKIINFDTLYEQGRYEVFSVIVTKVGSADEFKYYEFVDFKDKDEFNKFISECKRRTLINTGIEPLYEDRILTLSTCSYNTDNERFVVFARKIS